MLRWFGMVYVLVAFIYATIVSQAPTLTSLFNRKYALRLSFPPSDCAFLINGIRIQRPPLRSYAFVTSAVAISFLLARCL